MIELLFEPLGEGFYLTGAFYRWLGWSLDYYLRVSKKKTLKCTVKRDRNFRMD